MTKDTGGQAFPCVNPHYDGNWNKNPINDGMTLRDYFAAKALQAWLVVDLKRTGEETMAEVYEYAAKEAYIIADAMLKEREK